jgi:endonuclease G
MPILTFAQRVASPLELLRAACLVGLSTWLLSFTVGSGQLFAEEYIQPVSYFFIQREGYSLAYDARHKNPHWVYEILTEEGLKGSADRSHCAFKEDETIPEHLRASPSDYHGHGYDRGHMAPAADHRASQEAMDDTFFMSNICPQNPKLNRYYWAVFEKHIRDLTKDYKNIHVITGPAYLPTIEEGGRRYVKFEVIGPHDIAVPTHFFKIIALESYDGVREIRAYLLPNQEIPNQTPLDNFKTTLEKVERVCGFILRNIE